MKRSFFKELGLESDVIDKIMSENGRDIEKYKTEIEDYVSEIKELKVTNSDNSKAIEDAVKLKEQELREEFKESIEKAEKYDDVFKENEELKATNSERVFNEATNKLFEKNNIEFTSNVAKEATISKFKEKNFELDNNEFKEDALNFLKELKGNDAGAFKETTPGNTGGIGNFGRGNGVKGTTRDEFKQMTMTQRLKLKNENPNLYSELTEG
ncbi:MAG: hypothetical protein RSC84_02590 [Peptostreptococcaceae bacterium]